MANYHETRKVYYHVLEGKSGLLADERDKWRLLRTLLAVSRENGWSVYAFCLTDDGAYLITETENADAVQRDLRHAVNDLSAFGRTGETLPLYGSGLLHEEEEELDSPLQIAGRCRKLHRIPLDRGYVRHISDYWWSSYITYIGNYEWEMVDCRTITRYFSADPEDALRRLRRFHGLSDSTDENEIAVWLSVQAEPISGRTVPEKAALHPAL